MTAIDSIPNTPLPTLDRLGASLPSNLDAKVVAKQWFAAFSAALSASDTQSLSALFVSDAFWRDMLALTWDFRTFSGLSSISQFLTDRLAVMHPRSFSLREDAFLGLQQPFPDVAWVHLMFDFETDAGISSGIARLVPTSDGEWRAHTVYTNLEDLKGFPEKNGLLRDQEPNHGRWEENRRREREFRDREPVVVIIGGGHGGLSLAARLKCLDVPTLVVEKNPRIGDNWRNRYDALCLHDPVWYDHLPYLPFPPTWPVYTPALKLADWLETYASSLDLNVWTSSAVTNAASDASGSKWTVAIECPDGKRVFKEVKHVVFATGLGGGDEGAKLPVYPGMDIFKGEMLHSSQHKRALDHEGKKVVVIGACTSAHDITADYYEHGVDVTMFQRSSTYVMSSKNGLSIALAGLYSEHGPPADIADRLFASYPHYMSIGMGQRTTQKIAELDKDLLDALRARGFQLNDGIHGTGFGLLAWTKGGGFYFDTGTSQLIADGKIKLKSGPQIERFTNHAIRFDDGSELEADVVVFATGLGDCRAHIQRICGATVVEKCNPIWGFDKDGEINCAWRDIGVRGLWYMLGNLALARFHSKHVALQIKAMEEGIFGERYSAVEG